MATGAAMAVAGAPLRTTSPCCYCPGRKLTSLLSNEIALSNPRFTKPFLYLSNPRLRFGSVSDWSGLKHLGVSFRYRSRELKSRCRDRTAYASLFGVGAPEALVIGVVALLVFGPKGLAEVAKNLGKTLRAFQPTIRELQDVSREFKSTLEREIGLDEVQSSLRSPYSSNSPVKDQMNTDPNGVQSTTRPYSSEEDLLKITEEQLASASTSQTADTGREQLQASATGTPEVSAASTTIPEAGDNQTITPEIAVAATATPELSTSGAASEANTQIPQEK